jgi:NAD(P)-dependent dehydrogenase (short-subunit alcohol dehydrogenase family)
MELSGKVAVVTGGAQGIGEAMCRRFAAEGSAGIVIADLDDRVHAVARALGAHAVVADVTREPDVQRIVAEALEIYGRIDLFCSNAGIFASGAEDTSDADWDRIWRVNVMAHIYAARAVVPGMIGAGGGCLLQTASAAGLLTQIGSAPYAVTKHAAIAFAEWLAITYGDQGLKVSCLCPQGVRTRMLNEADGPARGFVAATAIDPARVADAVVEGLRAERFLILPHPDVGEYFRRKADDYDRWLRGMRRLQRQIAASEFPFS